MPPKRDSEFEGYVPINRKFFKHPFWTKKRVFSESEAWLYLIQGARFEEPQAHMLMGGRLVSWTRGQLPASLRFLCGEWQWSKNKVDGFLKLLEAEGMIKRTDVNGQTVITLCNYDNYNKKGQRKGHLSDYESADIEEYRDSKKDEVGTGSGQGRDNTNKVNKGNNGNSVPTPPTQDDVRFKAFTDWIAKNAPNVAKMREPFTLEQFVKLRAKMEKPQVQALLLKMHNYKPLVQKNVSAYLTILNWSAREYNQPGEGQKEKGIIV